MEYISVVTLLGKTKWVLRLHPPVENHSWECPLQASLFDTTVRVGSPYLLLIILIIILIHLHKVQLLCKDEMADQTFYRAAAFGGGMRGWGRGREGDAHFKIKLTEEENSIHTPLPSTGPLCKADGERERHRQPPLERASRSRPPQILIEFLSTLTSVSLNKQTRRWALAARGLEKCSRARGARWVTQYQPLIGPVGFTGRCEDPSTAHELIAILPPCNAQHRSPCGIAAGYAINIFPINDVLP